MLWPLVFADIVILFAIVANFSRSAALDLLYAKTIARFGLVSALTAAACGGLLFGLLVKRRFSPLQRRLVPFAIAALPILAGILFFKQYTDRVVFPRQLKIVDCTNVFTSVDFFTPKGRSFYIVCAASNTLPARVRIESQSTNALEFALGVENSREQFRFFREQTKYHMEIRFDASPQPTSIWLHWLQAKKDIED